MTLIYALALLAVFYLLLIAEFFLPSGGLIGTAAVAVLVAAIVIAFSHSLLAGVSVVVLALFTTPVILFGALRIWPYTPIGRRMLNRRPGEMDRNPPQRTTSRGTRISQLVGYIGTAKTDLLPSGMVVINGEKMDAVSTGMPIDAGTTIIVTSVEVGRLHVREATDADLFETDQPLPQSPPSLEESLDSFDAD